MVEMMEAASILRHATGRSLVVLDEIGRGTSTFDGLSIARAVVEEVHERIGARTLFATHFHELAGLADELPRVRVFNSAVAEEGNDIVFLRKVVPGGADRSYGIQVARLAGLPSSVTERAEQILRELETRGTAAPTYHDGIPRPRQLALDGIGLGPTAPADLLEEILDLDPANLTPVEALNKLWDIQRRAGKL
jgi:DNA mismatch repair protein MutS